jgi:hypothetical protein
MTRLEWLIAALVAETVILGVTCGPTHSQTVGQPPIARRPPAFQTYDVDRRMRDLRRNLGQLAGTPALSQARADALLGRLNHARDDEAARRAAHGGRLTPRDLAAINHQLDAIARDAGLRKR